VPYDLICCPWGTGGTLAGLALGSAERALGFAVLKGGEFLNDEVARLQGENLTTNWSVETRFHFGGYARRTAELDGFLADFDRRHGVVLDWIYTGR
jgi:1-aminocyclopropane-1-carboxylate deaminase